MTVPSSDVHAHLAVPAVDELIADEPGLARRRQADAATLGPAALAYSQAHIADLAPRLTDLDLRLEAMDRAKVDIQAVTAVPLLHLWADQRLATRIVAVTNEAIASYCRLVGVGTVSLQHPGLAVAQMTDAMETFGCAACRSPPRAGRAWSWTTRAWRSSGRRPMTWEPPSSSIPGAALSVNA
ncbi:Amidohydrolase [Actinomadura madurae]|uniref:Amidohydrolase n=1 Tax=Actinomadura madurae TaxID=1993 RepID=A0A1I5SA89_9ACTN|nr:amidohydrolase family protein [Actinomadura madurae]SFP67477.1 Amidohydrolase [Actinomadura madurae]